MWEILHNNADQNYFKTLILQETLKTQSRHQVKFCAISEVKRSRQQVECERNNLLFHTVLRKLK